MQTNNACVAIFGLSKELFKYCYPVGFVCDYSNTAGVPVEEHMSVVPEVSSHKFEGDGVRQPKVARIAKTYYTETRVLYCSHNLILMREKTMRMFFTFCRMEHEAIDLSEIVFAITIQVALCVDGIVGKVPVVLRVFGLISDCHENNLLKLFMLGIVRGYNENGKVPFS